MRNDAAKSKKASKGILARLSGLVRPSKNTASPKASKAAPKAKGVKAQPVISTPDLATKAASARATPAVAPARRSSAKTRVAAGIKDSSICREVACESLATTAVYCRLHYIKNWKKIRLKEQILGEGKLNQFIDELVTKYPDKYIEAIHLDLSNDKDFIKVVQDLELAEPAEEFETGADSDGAEEGLVDTIRRDFDEEPETF